MEAGGVVILSPMKRRKLLISLNAQNDQNFEFAQVRYTAGTRP